MGHFCIRNQIFIKVLMLYLDVIRADVMISLMIYIFCFYQLNQLCGKAFVKSYQIE